MPLTDHRGPPAAVREARMSQPQSPAAPETATVAQDLNPFHIATQQFDRAVRHLPHIPRRFLEFVKAPDRTVIIGASRTRNGDTRTPTPRRN